MSEILRRKIGRPRGSRDRSGHARRVSVAVDRNVRSSAAWRAFAVAFGLRLRDLLEERDVAASELAAAVGCSPYTVHAWTAGRHFPSVPALLVMAAALDCSLVDLMPDDAHHRVAPVRERRAA